MPFIYITLAIICFIVTLNGKFGEYEGYFVAIAFLLDGVRKLAKKVNWETVFDIFKALVYLYLTLSLIIPILVAIFPYKTQELTGINPLLFGDYFVIIFAILMFDRKRSIIERKNKADFYKSLGEVFTILAIYPMMIWFSYVRGDIQSMISDESNFYNDPVVRQPIMFSTFLILSIVFMLLSGRYRNRTKSSSNQGK